MSTVASNTTNRLREINASQPSLWEPEAEIVYHQVMEVHFHGGREETYCSAKSYRPTGGFQIYAGYVGFPAPAEDCPLCAKEAIA